MSRESELLAELAEKLDDPRSRRLIDTFQTAKAKGSDREEIVAAVLEEASTIYREAADETD